MYTSSTSKFAPIVISNSKHYLLLFLIWPFLAFITALANYGKKESKTVVYIFLIYYGFNFVNSNEAVDAFRYALSLKINAQLPFSDFFKIVGGIYATDTSLDIIEPLVSFIVSRFTSNFGVYFAVWAAIFGFFYLKSINLLYERHRENPGWNTMIMLVFFIMILPITSISGVRMWTAAWVFFYGAYHVVLYRNPKYILLTLAASLLHWSFFSANAILLIYFFVGNRNLVYVPLALSSFVLPQIFAPIFQIISLRMGGAFQNRYEGYSSEGYVLAHQDSLAQASWFLQIGNNIVFYFLLLSIVVIQIRTFKTEKEKEMKNLFSFLLLFLTFVNIGIAIPSLGSRFQIIFFLFATLYVFLFFQKIQGNRINLLTLLGLFPIALYSAITFRLGSESINAWIFTPGLGFPAFVPVLSISELLFQ